MEIWAVVVAGGSGARFGRPKQLATLGDRRVIDHSIDAVRAHVSGVVVVGSSELGDAASLNVASVVPGGQTRSGSVRQGLVALPASATHVLIHDAARPLVSHQVVSDVVSALAEGAEAVVPVIPVTDTLRAVDGGTVDRSRFVAVQTPQGFVRQLLADAHASEAEGTDDAGVVEAGGVQVAHVPGSANNLKITFPHDLAVAEALLSSLEREMKE
ncbi:MAG: 2-C-methyl-D-erythritol 4-phosphate cytidylyltransferase [Acidimicrobiales bacterium]